ncbi:MAG TPA: nucleoside recognition domain-containing protein [Clostridia bacterium]
MPVNNRNSRIYTACVILIGFFILLLINPDSIIDSGRKGVNLCLNIIFPSLLPFFVVSRLILDTGAIWPIGRLFEPLMKPLFNLPGNAAFPLIAGWLSGYPAGAKYTADLYEKKLLTREQAQRLLAFCNNSGPLFIVGAVGTGFFGSSQLGFALLLCHVLASITIGIGMGLVSRIKKQPDLKKTVSAENKPEALSGRLLANAIVDSVMILLRISGTIIFFAVLVQTLDNIGFFQLIGKIPVLVSGTDYAYNDIIKVFFAGSLEITYGLYILSMSYSVPAQIKIILAGFLCGFGGFSVYTQVTGVCPQEFNLKKYFCGKVLHGLTAALYSAVFLRDAAIETIKHNSEALYNTGYSSILSFLYIAVITTGIAIILSGKLIRKAKPPR